ncbi:hypothetical protein [Trichothermofontia sp.]
MGSPEYIQPNRFVIVEGLVGYATRNMRDSYDVKVYLAPSESLRADWKIRRDTLKRGYTREQVLEQLRQWEDDSEQFIRPQRQWANVVVTFYPPSAESQDDLLLNVRLVLRPTIPHPDFSTILNPEGNHLGAAIRLQLDRDMGKPVDVLEVDGHAAIEPVRELEHLLCQEVPYLGQFCSLEGNENIGKVIGDNRRNPAKLPPGPYPITELLITYHSLKTLHVH